MAEQNQDVVIASSNSGDIGRTNTIPDSIAEIRLSVPCYKDYALQEKDSDKQKTWGASTQTETGTWVKDLQEDLISFGIEKYGLVVEHTQPRPPKIIKTTTHEPLMKHGEPVMKQGHPVMKAVIHKTIEPQSDKVLYWEKVTLKPSGIFDKATTAALKLFQWHGLKVCRRAKNGSDVSVPTTFTGSVTGKMDTQTCLEIKEWKAKSYKIIGPNVQDTPLKFDNDKFIELYESAPRLAGLPFIKLTDERKTNLRTFLGFVEQDTNIIDIRWLAYMLATSIHECRSGANQWQFTWAPISETPDSDGKYNGGSYGDPEFVVDDHNKKIDESGKLIAGTATGIKRQYYGRGYVQLTHQVLYRKFDALLGMNHSLHTNPDSVLDIGIAYKIMSTGMRDGGYNGLKLGDFISGENTNYFGARALINGDRNVVKPDNLVINGSRLSNGNLIKYYAEIFEWIIYNSLINP